MLTALIFLLILSVLVLIHEAGHFFVAKKFGIKVEEFGFGLPLTKPLFSIKKGETKYSFYPALIGGFVKLYGEDEAGRGAVAAPTKNQELRSKNFKDMKRAYFARPIWQRASVVGAGVVMNTLLAVVVFYLFLFISGFVTPLPVLGEKDPGFIGAEKRFIPKGIAVGEVADGSPAQDAGMEAPAVILTIQGVRLEGEKDIIDLIDKNLGKEIAIEWYDFKADKNFVKTMIPRKDPPEGEGALGISFGYNDLNTVIVNYNTPTQIAFSGFSHTYNTFLYSIGGFGELINKSVQEKTVKPLSDSVGGPVLIFNVVGQIIEIPDLRFVILQILNLAGVLSISLAFFNVLPIPGLDGGRLFFIAIEAVTRRKLNPKFEAYANSIGILILIGLIIVVTFKDLAQVFFK